MGTSTQSWLCCILPTLLLVTWMWPQLGGHVVKFRPRRWAALTSAVWLICHLLDRVTFWPTFKKHRVYYTSDATILKKKNYYFRAGMLNSSTQWAKISNFNKLKGQYGYFMKKSFSTWNSETFHTHSNKFCYSLNIKQAQLYTIQWTNFKLKKNHPNK